MKKSLVVSLPFVLAACIHDVNLSSPPAAAADPALAGKAEVFVVRPGIMAFAVAFGIAVNGTNVGSIRSNDYVHAAVDPGTVTVAARAEKMVTATFPAEANHRYYVRAIPKMGWLYSRVQLELMDPVAGANAVLGLEDHTQ